MAPSTLTITAANEEEQQALLLVADCCKQQVACTLGPETSANLSSGTVTGFNTVCRAVVEAAGKADALLGADADTQAEVYEWMSFRHSHLTPLTDSNLMLLNQRLLSRMFVVGGHLTLADLVLFGTVHKAVVAFPAAQTLHFCNLLRWWDFVSHTADLQSRFPRLKLQQGVFVAPTLPAPKQASAAPSNASSATKGAPPTPNGTATPQKTPPKAPAAPAADANAAKSDKTAAKEAKKEAKKEKDGAKKEKAPKAAEVVDIGVDLLDIRVGTIVKVDKHPNADSLYLEEIDLGEDKARQVVSGLVKFVPVDKMQNRRVVVVCNLKPAKMRDVMSYGMVLCASNAAHDHVDPINPPEGVPNGESVTFEGFTREPEAQINPKKKIFEQIAPDLLTNADGVVVYKGVSMQTTKGPVTATIPNATVA